MIKKQNFIILIVLLCVLFAGCTNNNLEPDTNETPLQTLGSLNFTSSMPLSYAEQFTVDYYDSDYALVSISDGTRFLLVSEGAKRPENLDSDIVVLQQPVTDVYLTATSAMCLFDALESLDSITMSGTRAKYWYIENAKMAMETGEIAYAGKYSEPDYEMILASGCKLSVQSTMISHAPEVKEKLIDLGIPVLVDQSSYEPHPLGRTEWIKLYAVLLGKSDLAESLFADQVGRMDAVLDQAHTGKSVAFFYISSSGYAVVRKPGDYVTKMIELAGGTYVFNYLGDPKKATSTVNMEMEEFYRTAKNADCIIYNSTIGGEVQTIDELIQKNHLLADFLAVQTGNVWCTKQNLYQDMTNIGVMTAEMHQVFAANNEELSELQFLYKLY